MAIGVLLASLAAQPTAPSQLDAFQRMLKQHPRPERKLTPAEAGAWMGGDPRMMYSVLPDWKPKELRTLSVKRTADLASALRQVSRLSKWIAFELYVRRDRGALPALMAGAKGGNPWAVVAMDRTDPKGVDALRTLVKSAPGEAKAAAGALLGARGDREGIPGMRLAADRYPQWRHGSTIPNLIRWVDHRDAARLRTYSRDDYRLAPVLREVGTRQCLTALFEQARASYQGDRTWALREIAQLKDPRTRSAMRTAALDDYPHIRRLAADWFLFYAVPTDLPAITQSLATTPAQEGNTSSGTGWREVMEKAKAKASR